MARNIRAQYAEAVEQFRRQKDEYLRSAEASPIPEEERARFKGLRYYPANLDLRIIARVHRLPEGNLVQMETTDGLTRLYQRYAHLRFDIGDRMLQLTAFRSADSDTAEGEQVSLFVPFRDSNAGRETYGAGRYLDVEEEPAEDGKGTVVLLDFNLAYNPYCAYNEQYSCPLTPLENHVPIAIEAGEKTWH